jgi:hypothetical protein
MTEAMWDNGIAAGSMGFGLADAPAQLARVPVAIVEESVGDLMFAGVDGMIAPRLGGKLYNSEKLSQLRGYLERRGIRLLVGREHVPESLAGAFEYTGTITIRLLDNPTEYEVWHEVSHYLHYRKVGPEAYSNLTRRYVEGDLMQSWNVPEQYVYDQLNGPRRWLLLNEEERAHASRYIIRLGGLR